MQNMSEHVYYSEPQRILYRLLDSTHITQTIAGNTLVTELPQYSSELVSKRKTQISANGLIYNNLHGNQCNNFHIPDILDFLWNSNKKSPNRQTIRRKNFIVSFVSMFLDSFGCPKCQRCVRCSKMDSNYILASSSSMSASISATRCSNTSGSSEQVGGLVLVNSRVEPGKPPVWSDLPSVF